MVVAESGANVKTVLSTKIAGEPCSGIFLYDDTESNWSKGGGVIVKETVEVPPI